MCTKLTPYYRLKGEHNHKRFWKLNKEEKMWLLQAKKQIWKNNKETKQNHKSTKINQSITFQLKTSLNIFDWWVFLMRPHVCAQAPITWLSLLVYIDAKPNLDEEDIMLRLHFQPLAVGLRLAVFVGFTKAAATIVRRRHTWRRQIHEVTTSHFACSEVIWQLMLGAPINAVLG